MAIIWIYTLDSAVKVFVKMYSSFFFPLFPRLFLPRPSFPLSALLLGFPIFFDVATE